MKLDLNNPKIKALFQVNLAAGNVSKDYRDEFLPVVFNPEHLSGQVRDAINDVTRALADLIDLTNKELEAFDQDNWEDQQNLSAEERQAIAKELAEMDW